MTSPVFCALDVATVPEALALARLVGPHVGGLKLGLELFIAGGPDGVREVASAGLPIFLDLKLHDIPNTVAGAVRSAAALGPAFLTVHAAGGRAMLEAAAAAAAGSGMRLLGVTLLTSLDDADLADVGLLGPSLEAAARLALMARAAGLDGIVCAGSDIARLRPLLPPPFVLMVPGIRPAAAAAGDQKRTLTPAAALAAGADHLVIGRPITAAPDPAAAARQIAEEIASATAG
jgi:orotidine-5'-phosphate decarboxylase